MKLALVVNRFPTISETFLFNKVARLREAGVDVTVISHSRKDDSNVYGERLRALDIRRIFTFGVSRLDSLKLFLGSLPGGLFLLLRLLGELGWKRSTLKRWARLLPFQGRDFDIIHFSFSGVAVSYQEVLPELQRDATVFLSCRGSAEKIKPVGDPARAAVLPALFEQVDRVHCVSRDMRDGLARFGLDPEKAFVNPPSIDTDRFTRSRPYSEPEGELLILSTGTLHYKKGYPYGLQAIQLLRDRGLRFRYEIIGGGPEETHIRYILHESGLEDVVVLHGRQPSEFVYRKLEEADIFLLPSIMEGIANAALEAMAMELPIVTADAGGMREAIEDKVNGDIVPRFDGFALGERILRQAADFEMRREMGRKARETVVAGFQLEQQTETFLREYAPYWDSPPARSTDRRA